MIRRTLAALVILLLPALASAQTSGAPATYTPPGGSSSGGLASDPAACTAGQFVNDLAQDGTLTCAQPANVTGNAATATALAADPADCSAGTVAMGVNASGTATCTATPSVTTLTGAVTGNASTATALAADPSDCAAGTVAMGVNASGVATCTATPSVTTITGALSGNATTATTASGVVAGSGSVTFAGPTAARVITFPDAALTVHTGTGSANRVALWSGTSALTSDTGLTTAGTGGTFVLSTGGGFSGPAGAVGTPAYRLSGVAGGWYAFSTTGWFWGSPAGAPRLLLRDGGLAVDATSYLCIAAAAGFGSDIDTCLRRDAAGVFLFSGAASTVPGGYKVVADANGAAWAANRTTEATTLNTGGTSTVTAITIPAASTVKAILLRVTTTITTATAFTVKLTSGSNPFCQIATATTSNGTLTSGTTYTLVPCASMALADYQTAGSTSTITFTTTGTPGAGVVRITPIFDTFTPPTS